MKDNKKDNINGTPQSNDEAFVTEIESDTDLIDGADDFDIESKRDLKETKSATKLAVLPKKYAEKYKKKTTLEKILNSACDCLSEEEKKMVKSVIESI